MLLLVGNLCSNTSLCIPPASQEPSRKPWGSVLHILEKYSRWEKALDEGSGAGRGGLLPALACEKEYGPGKVPWKWLSVTASGDGGSGEGTGPRTAMAGMSPQELAVPSCSTHVTAKSSQAHPAPLLQLLQQGSCEPSPTNTAPSPGGNGEKKGNAWIHASSCSPVLRVSSREARGTHAAPRDVAKGLVKPPCESPVRHVGGSQHSQRLQGWLWLLVSISSTLT